MTLIEPNFFARYKTALVIGGLAILLVGVALVLYDCGEGAWFKSKVQKDKDAIKADTQKIANVESQIHELEKVQAAAQANVNTLTQELHKDLFGHEEAKKESNQALANLQKATETNSNVDRTVEDMNRVLEKLGQ